MRRSQPATYSVTEERAAVEQIEVDDLHDVAVVQAGGDPRLVHEHQRDALVRSTSSVRITLMTTGRTKPCAPTTRPR